MKKFFRTMLRLLLAFGALFSVLKILQKRRAKKAMISTDDGDFYITVKGAPGIKSTTNLNLHLYGSDPIIESDGEVIYPEDFDDYQEYDEGYGTYEDDYEDEGYDYSPHTVSID